MRRDRISVARAVLGVYVLCFSVGIAAHARDFVTHGWRPYQWGVWPLEVFWTGLILLDAVVVGLVLGGLRRSALVAAFMVMACDVAANSYALFGMDIQVFAGPLVLQTAFFGFVAGSVPFLWPRGG